MGEGDGIGVPDGSGPGFEVAIPDAEAITTMLFAGPFTATGGTSLVPIRNVAAATTATPPQASKGTASFTVPPILEDLCLSRCFCAHTRLACSMLVSSADQGAHLGASRLRHIAEVDREK